jgi:cob(I)alamin adenosyltransferase
MITFFLRSLGHMPNDDRDNPVVLSRIYTRTGDDGTTALSDGSRAAKTDTRLAAYADVEEANCAIGMAIALGGLDDEMRTLLKRIQNELFDAGADLAKPLSDEPALRIGQDYIDRLEQACDEWNEPLETLRSFVLPGGTPEAALLHMARTVTRRAERSAWAAVDRYTDGVSVLPARYLNRLSDLLFILARRANAGPGDVLWVPGEGGRGGGRGLGELVQARAGRGRLDPGEEAGERVLGQREFHRALVRVCLHHHPVRAERGGLRRCRGAP